MEQITLAAAWGWVIALAVALVTLEKGLAIVRRFMHPEADIREKVQKHDELLDKDHHRLSNLEEGQKETEHALSVMCQVMLAQLNHELSGNDVEHLKRARDKLNDYLTER